MNAPLLAHSTYINFMQPGETPLAPIVTCSMLVSGTVLGLAGIDLILPAIPVLPEIFHSSNALVQLVIAAYVLGTAAGLILFGSIGFRYSRRSLLISSLLAYAILSLVCALADDIVDLIFLRFIQGIASSAPAVFAPVIIKSIFDEAGATRALGVLGSIESLVPGGAPLVGAWLLGFGGWQVSFFVTAVLAVLLAATIFLSRHSIPSSLPERRDGSYLRLLQSAVYLRYSLSQALVLGGLLVFVFAAPTVIVHTMDGELKHFILMQMVGVTFFIIAANMSAYLAGKWGAESMIMLGTVIAVIGALLLLLYSVFGSNDPKVLVILFPLLNIGLGLRGPPGFLRVIIAGKGDDDRAAALMILAITGVSAGGTMVYAPFIGLGLAGLCLTVLLIQVSAFALLVFLPEYNDQP